MGKRLQLGATPDKDTPWMEVVGVVGDVKQNLAAEAPHRNVRSRGAGK